MLGGEGLDEITKLADAIKMESKLLNTRNILRESARNALIDLGEYK